jgi:hypothetical protein
MCAIPVPNRVDGRKAKRQGLGYRRRNKDMRKNSILAAIAAVSMAAAPAVAAPKPVGAPASSEIAPAGETVQGEQIRGGFLLPLAIIIAIIIGVLLLTNDDEDPISA